MLRVHGGPQVARLHGVPASVRVRCVRVRDHGGLEDVPDLPGDEHRLFRDLLVTRGTLDKQFWLVEEVLREGLLQGWCCKGPGYISVIAQKLRTRPSSTLSRTCAARRASPLLGATFHIAGVPRKRKNVWWR